MKSPRIWIGLSLTVAFCAWPYLSVWAHAHHFISHETESLTSLPCFAGAALGAVYVMGQFKLRPFADVCFSIVAVLAAIWVIFLSYRYSNRMFAYWLMHRIPANAWRQMASDLNSLAKTRAAKQEFGFERHGFPRSLDVLTCKGTFGTGVISPLNDEGIGVYAMYGDRNRKWILVVGPEDYLNSMTKNPYDNWSKMRCFTVATNAVFLVGSDW